MADNLSLDDAKQRLAAGFDGISKNYDRVPFLCACADRLVAHAAPQVGECVLDVGAGTGRVTIAAAQTVGPTGHVVGIDIAKEMLALARQKVAKAELSNVKLRLCDAEHLDFEDKSFDLVICSNALYFMPNIPTVVREWRRIVRPGGRVAFSAFGEESGRQLSDLFSARLYAYGVSLQPCCKQVDTPEKCHEVLVNGGFKDIAIHVEQFGYYFKSTDEYWMMEIQSSLLRWPLLQLPAKQLERLKMEHLAEVEALATEHGIWRDVTAIFAMGQALPSALR
jgi:ubiquinone/menaquinone biosynthesis C-methylase UbiE